MTFRFSLAILLLSPVACRNIKLDTAQDTATGFSTSPSANEDIDADNDGYNASEDCNDGNGEVNPGQSEVPYDGLDNDCDETTRDDDLDEDGHGIATDCDDQDPAVNPSATEICNEIDDDCNDLIDDATGENWYADEDQDGHGDPDVSTQTCEGVSGYVTAGTDCDDANSAVSPDADEICDGIDNDCDLLIDDEDPSTVDSTTWYGDLDGDGWGDAANTTVACEGPSLFVTIAEDCDDSDADVNPGATEICNSLDDDCDSDVDAEDDSVADLVIYYIDNDSDGHGSTESSTLACDPPSGFAESSGDCNDDDPNIWPGANESCNGLDDDCDGDADEAGASGTAVWYLDDDGDGYGDASIFVTSCEGGSDYVADDTDCDDSDSALNPGATELCNGSDDDCDTLVDDDDPDVADPSTWYDDTDGDGFGDSAASSLWCDPPTDTVSDDTDCDDTATDVNPDGTELCNGFDDDCDTLVDDDDPDVADTATWYLDFDGDGYGTSSTTVTRCEAPSGYVSNDQDCDDAYPEASPAGSEVCDNLDNDCNGTVDDGASDASSWYTDSDGDGYGDSSGTTDACSAPSNAVADATDCDDEDSTVNPAATEICNGGVDDDCDGDADDDDSSVDTSTMSTWYGDGDGDGYGTPDTTTMACDQPSNTSTNTTDCDDGDASANPGASEICLNATDENCDGQYNEGCAQQYADCGGPSTLDSGDTLSCSIGSTAVVEGVFVSVGCNDGETGVFTIALEDGASETINGSCDSTTLFSDHLSNSLTLTMDSGGGGDSHISMTCCGSGGWGIYYR